MFDYLMSLIGSTKTVMTWMHAAHHVTKGPGFGSDHVNIFGEIYEEIIEIFDELVEKSIVLCDDEKIACPIMITKLSSSILEKYESPVNLHSDQIAYLAYCLKLEFLS